MSAGCTNCGRAFTPARRPRFDGSMVLVVLVGPSRGEQIPMPVRLCGACNRTRLASGNKTTGLPGVERAMAQFESLVYAEPQGALS